mmetsp:Transcript_26868/g.48543  ORF Transcript_26868/g.48543 Transcript_26868/m.48543 type:complete len:131 (+) Transcript_26868:1-393(+)
MEDDSARGLLLMSGYPPLPYELSEDGKVLDIANFPPHYVRRLDTWEWEITNANVTFVSCFDDDVQYDERCFLKLPTVESMLNESNDLVTREEAREIVRNGGNIPQHFLLIRLLHSIMRSRSSETSEEHSD